MKFTKFFVIAMSALLLFSLVIFGMTPSTVDAARPPTKTPQPTATLDPYPNRLSNPGFESCDLSGWSNSGNTVAALVQYTSPHSGNCNLAHWDDQPWSVYTYQTLTGLPDGSYSFKGWFMNWGVTTAYIKAENCGGPTLTATIPPLTIYSQITIPDIPVTGGQCTVGIFTSSDVQAIVADDMEFRLNGAPPPATPTPTAAPPHTMYVGGDITYRRLAMASGGRYANQAGQEQDVLDVLAGEGFDLARIRIYNEPGNFIDYNGSTYQLQPGYQDLNDAVQNAQAAKARGMKIFISLHYSDFWTNPGIQMRPVAWANYNKIQLRTATYNYTVQVMNTLMAAGVTPEYVSIGNEINNGIMDTDRWSQTSDYFALLKKASDAVKATSPSTKVVIHLTIPDQSAYAQWIADAQANGLNYDIMGASLYPFWSNLPIYQLADFVTWVSNESGKPVMICEVGYPWTLNAAYPSEQTLIQANNLDPDGPENYGATPSGQLLYMQQYFRAMYNTNVVEGISYWDPISIDMQEGADPTGWVVGGDNEVEDTSFFDYQNPHRALISLDAFHTWQP